MTIKKKLPSGLSAREYRGRTQYRARLVDRSQTKLDGRNVQVNSRWFDKQGEAKSWLQDKQRSLITIGSLKTDKTITVAKACEKFMEVSKTVGVNGRAPIEDATWQRYGSTYRTVIVGTIDLIKIADLRPGMIHEWVQQLAASRGSDAAHRALGLLKMVLDYQVVVAEAIPANPAKSVNIAKRGANDNDDPDSGVVTDFMSPGDVRRLLTAADDLAAGTGDAFKAQAAAEVIFLTHNEQLHEVNLGWHPKAERLLWTPETQQAKWSQTGGRNVRYRTGFKGERVRDLTDLIAARTPWLRVRYAF